MGAVGTIRPGQATRRHSWINPGCESQADERDGHVPASSSRAIPRKSYSTYPDDILSTHRVECGSDVGVEVGVDTTRDADGSFYDDPPIPYFLERLRGGTAVSDRSDGRSGLFQQS